MKTFTAKPVVVPKNLPEMLDEQAGQEKGFLRNLIADKGKLHDLEIELLSIGLMSRIKGIMEAKDIDGDKPLSVERLSNVIYVTMFAYCTGTMRVLDDGEVTFGEGTDDVRTALEVAISKNIKFTSGRTMPTKDFLKELRLISEPSSISAIYGDIVKRSGVSLSKNISPQSAFSVAKVAMITAKQFMGEE